MSDIEAFEEVAVAFVPAVVVYNDKTYRSDRTYTDVHGSVWAYYGLFDGASMWLRDDEDTAWNISSVADQFGPLTEGDTAAPKSLEQENARLTAELEKYVGKEPTVRDEMAYLQRCLNAVRELCDAAAAQAGRWENPLPVPEWVTAVRQAAEGDRPDDPADNRRRLYVDGNGNGWISTCVEDGVEHVVPVQPAALVEESIEEIAAEHGGLHEIGRCW